MRIEQADPLGADVRPLLDEHLTEMHATSPAESVHALDAAALAAAHITFVVARDEDGTVLGCGALSELSPVAGELKSMRTAQRARGRGIASAVLAHLVGLARERGYERVSLETGTEGLFAAARHLYTRRGFQECPPFADYRHDPHSAFYTLDLSGERMHA